MQETESKEFRKMYEYFKLMWMQEHGYSLEDLIGQLESARQDLLDEDASIQTVYEHWEDNIGFGGEIWPCFEEFLDYEYKALNAMLGVMGVDTDEI